MQPPYISLDYYAGTRDYDTTPHIWFGELPPIWQQLHGRQGYKIREQELFTGLEFMYNPDRQIMGCHIDLSGAVLQRFVGCHPYLTPIDALDKSGISAYKPSRIDVAIDIPDAGLFARDLYNQFVKVPAPVGRRKVTLIHSTGDRGGKTVYVGSRTSPLFLRIYDKDAQSAGKNPVSRIEFELKGAAAKKIHSELWTVKRSLSEVAAGLLLTVGTIGAVPELAALIDGQRAIEWEPREPAQTSTEKWLVRQVLPTFVQDALVNGYPLLLDWFFELVWERIRTSMPVGELDALITQTDQSQSREL
ncbi:MAG: replication initiation factor [Circular genetic element sp.]|nr:MAG: replication initiation factor [Circular genetic element sp.]